MKIRAIVIRNYANPTVETIDNDLETLQGLVGGYIEAVPLTHDLMLWCDEEGMLKNLPRNIVVNATNGTHVIAGTAVITRVDHNDGDTTSVQDDDLEFVMKKALRTPAARMTSQQLH